MPKTHFSPIFIGSSCDYIPRSMSPASETPSNNKYVHVFLEMTLFSLCVYSLTEPTFLNNSPCSLIKILMFHSQGYTPLSWHILHRFYQQAHPSIAHFKVL